MALRFLADHCVSNAIMQTLRPEGMKPYGFVSSYP